MLPGADRRRPARVEVVAEPLVQRQVEAPRKMVDPDHRAAVVAADPGSEDRDVGRRGSRLHPGLVREARLVERAELRQVDALARAAERKRRAEAAGRPRRADDRRHPVVAGDVHRGRAARIVERIRGHESRGDVRVAGERLARERRARRGVSGRVERLDSERVGRPAREPGEGVGRAGDDGDRNAPAGHPVSGHGHVIGGRLPGGVDLADGRARLREARRRRRRAVVRVCDRLGHVRLDLLEREGAAVDAHLVDRPVVEAGGARAVGADPPGVRVAHVAREGLARRLDAVHVEARHRAVVGRGQMLPLSDRGSPARVEVVGDRALVQRQPVAAREMVDPDHRAAVVASDPGAEHGDVGRRRPRLHPGLEREARLVERPEPGEVDARGRAVQRGGRPEAPRRPARAPREGAVPSVSGGVGRDGAGVLVEGVRRHEARRGRAGGPAAQPEEAADEQEQRRQRRAPRSGSGWLLLL